MISRKFINLIKRLSLVRFDSNNAIRKQKKREIYTSSISFGEVPEFRKVHNGLKFRDQFVDSLWLRINCRCDQCYYEKSHQRELSFINIDENVECEEINAGTSGQVRVTWSDKHESVYDVNWVLKNVAENLDRKRPEARLWTGKDWKNYDTPNVEYKAELPTQVLVREVLTNIFVHGFCSVSQVEPKFEEIESLIRRLVPIQKNFWGEMWEVRAEEKKSDYDTAFSSRYLPPHNDNTYFAYSPGLQVFSCLEAAAAGGETILVDGFQCARVLREREPEAYECLLTTPVQSAYKDNAGNQFTHCDHVLKPSQWAGHLQQIRFNPLDVGNLSNLCGETLRSFYSAYKKLSEEVLRESNRLTIRWTPGTVVFIDNWRLLHGRNAFSGERHLCGCYVSRDDYVHLLHKHHL